MTYLSTQKTPAIAPNYLEATPLKRLLAALLAGLALNACSGGSGVGLDQSGRPTTGDASSGNTPPTTGSASFESIQDSVFTPICTVCHAGGSAPLGLKLDAANAYAMLVGVSSVQVPGIARVAPGDPDNSYLIQKLEGTAASGGQMPLGGPPLSADNIELIRRWIIDGALPPGQQTPGESPPTVLSVSPQADSVLASAPQDISASFSQNMDSSLVSDLTFTLTASGGDGSFIEGNEVAVMPTGVTLVNAQTAAMDLAGLSISDDLYEARLVGSGATALAGVSGLVLDGDSDGLEGGDFAWRFTIDSGVAVAQPTWRWIQDNIFTPICTQCHISGGIAGFLILDELSSYANTVNVPSTEVASLNLIQPGSPDTSYLLQKLEGTAAVGAQMPLGLPALDTESIAAVRDWILDGALLEPGDPMPDVLAPVVTLSVPPSPLMNSVTLSATAVDDTGVALVRFYVDGELIGSDASDPYAAVWETLSVANGEHIVAAEAADLAGNIGRSADVIVEVANPLPPDVIAPTVSVTNPGSPLSGTVFVTTLAEDNEAVIAVRLFIDEQLVASFAAPPYQYSWDTAQAANGTHTLRAEADDAAGNVGASATISVTVDNGLPPDTEAPTVAINNLTSPVSGPVTVTMSASDNVGVTVVRLFADGVLIGSDSALPYSIIWDSTTVTDGPHVLTAEAQDAAGNTGASGPLVVTVENNPGPQATWRWIQDNIFDPLCVSCHVTGGIADFLWLDEASSFNQLVNAATTEGGPQFRVLPGNPDNSALVQRLEGTLTPQMPLGALPLSAAEIAAVRQWILDGALQSPPADTTAPVVSLAPTPIGHGTFIA